jgi:hypothetical protein
VNITELTEERRQAIAKTIRTISVEELKALGEGLFPYAESPWREKFFNFLNENSGATFHYATTDDRIHFIYCHTQGKGMWFVPGSGMGPLQAKGVAIMKEIVERSH